VDSPIVYLPDYFPQVEASMAEQKTWQYELHVKVDFKVAQIPPCSYSDPRYIKQRLDEAGSDAPSN
jgi:hypothetical protein